jgi:uncharacterized protein
MSARPSFHVLRRGGRCLVLHVPASRVFAIDPDLAGVVEALAEGARPEVAAARTADETLRRRAMRVVDQLVSMDSSEPAGPAPEETSGRFDTLDLHVCHDCNMRCSYCYASGGSFGRERRIMPVEVARRAVDVFLEHCAHEGLLNICFDGGEPLLAFGRMREVTAYALARSEELGRIMALSIGTNGTVVNDEIAAFLKTNRFGTQVSIDGVREAHDRLRPMRGGRGTFDLVMANVGRLQAAGVHVAGRITVTPHNLELAETVELMHRLGLIRIAAFPATAVEGDAVLRACDVDRLCSELDAVAERYLEVHLAGERMMFSNFGDRLRDLHMAKRRHWCCGAGRTILSVDPAGDLYPCHRFVGTEAFRLGSLVGGIDEDAQQRFFDNTVLRHATCAACWARHLCGGGCAVDAFFVHGRLDEPFEPMCELTRHEIEHAIVLYSRLREKAPAMLDEIGRVASVGDLRPVARDRSGMPGGQA